MTVPAGISVAQQTITGGPPAVRGQPAVCSHPNGLLYFYGGNNLPSNALNDFWSLNTLTNSWTQITTTHNPGVLVGAVIGYDPISTKIILFGGDDEVVASNKTWTIDPTAGTPDWTQLTPGASPSARTTPAIFNDPVTNKLCIYGGNNLTPTYFDELWTWSGTTWVETSSALTGTGRTAAQVATLTNGTAVIFGGWNSTVPLNDTWVWNGSTVTHASPSIIPPGRSSAGMAASPITGVALMYGGDNLDTDNNLSDCWLWNGSDWTLVTPTGSNMSAISSQAMVWSPSLAQIVSAFGTQGTTDAETGDINTVYYIQAGPVITNVQGSTASATNQTTVTLTPKQVGNLAILNFAIEGSSAVTISSITDTGITPTTGAGAWTLVKRTAGVVEQWAATISAIAAATITVHLSGTTGDPNDLVVSEYNSGLGITTAWTVITTGASSSGTNVTTVTHPSLTSTAANQLYQSYASCTNTASAGTTAGFSYFITPQTEPVVTNSTAPNSTVEAPTNPMSSGTYSAVAAIFAAFAAGGNMFAVLGL